MFAYIKLRMIKLNSTNQLINFMKRLILLILTFTIIFEIQSPCSSIPYKVRVEYPRLDSFVDIQLDSMAKIHTRRVAIHSKNPGNLCIGKVITEKGDTIRKWAKYNTIKEGFNAMNRLIKKYQKDSTLTLNRYLKRYGVQEWYQKEVCRILNITPDTKIYTIHTDSLQKYQIMCEDRKVFELIYD